VEKNYQIVILGGGPAGLAAGLYASRNKINTLLIEKAMMGGLAVYSELIENYPGFPDGIDGVELGKLMLKQAEKFGLKTVYAEVTGLDLKRPVKIVKTSEGDFTAKAVIIALGSERIKLDAPGEKEFVGRGVSYCATCDAAFFRDTEVAVAGGGNSAISEAVHLAKFASKVTLIHRRDKWRATPVFVDKAKAETKINYIMNTNIDEIEGEENVKQLRLTNAVTGEKSVLPVSGVFIAIGQKPNTDLVKDVVKLDSVGYIITNEKMETGLPGVFAAGDIRSNSIRQTITAAGDGATAAIYADRFIQ
jgi:thioredoxin reductase (NADPH)